MLLTSHVLNLKNILKPQKRIEDWGAGNKETIIVFNKIDNGDDLLSRLKARAKEQDSVFISCKTGEGIDELLLTIEKKNKSENSCWKIQNSSQQI